MDKGRELESRRCEKCDWFFTVEKNSKEWDCPKCSGLYCRSCGKESNTHKCKYCGYESLNR